MNELEELIELATSKGGDKKYREWISHQPSCVSGQFSEWHNGEGRSIACHVRRAIESGTGFKPPYCCVPLTFQEHAIQHGKLGEEAFGGKGWFDRQRVKYLRSWLES